MTRGSVGGRAERFYRLLLRAYPRRFREQYGEEVVEAFRDRHREAAARGRVTTGLLWLRTIPDVVAHGLVERFGTIGGGGEGFASLRAGVRGLSRAPGLNGAIVLTLAVGIGANVALFTVLKGVLLTPLPFEEPERLVRLWERNPAVDEELHGPSPLNFADWARETSTFESMTAWYLTSGTYRTGAWVEEIRSAQVTADFFRVLGAEPLHGRDFQPEEVVGYGPVMLSHSFWQRRFGGDPGVVGQTVISSGNSYEIVGVMPPDFDFPDESVEAWVAWDLPSVYAGRPETRTWRFLFGLGRLDHGVSLAEAESELDGVAASLAEQYPIMNDGWETALTTLHEETVGEVRSTLWIAFGSVLFILLIACANVANLLLARLPSRVREMGIRTTLGASRGRIARELLVEHLLLAFVAGALGLLLGALFLDTMVAIDAGRIPRLEEVRLDAGVFAFTAMIATATSVLFGLAPVSQILRLAVVRSIGSGMRTTGGRGQRRLREGFVAAQVSIAVVLLCGAALLGRSLAALRAVDPGIDPENVAAFRVSLDPIGGGEGSTVTYYDGLLARIAEVPGVVRVGASQTLPLNPVSNDFQRPYRPLGAATEAALAPTVQMRIVTPGYPEAIGMRFVEGASIPASTRLGEPLVALVNETLAKRLWPDGGALGESFEIDFREGWLPYRVVGVVQDVKHYGLRAEPVPEVFLSHAQVPYLAMNVIVRTVGDPAAMTPALDAAVRGHLPMQPPHDFVTLEELHGASTAEERFLSVLLGVFAAIALLLASTGVYGVVAYTVSRRRAEIGVRMALGAEPGGVRRGVVARMALLALVGAAAGVVVVVALSGVLAGVLYGVEPTDPLTIAATAALLLAVTTLAALPPTRRVAAIAPAEALRSE